MPSAWVDRPPSVSIGVVLEREFRPRCYWTVHVHGGVLPAHLFLVAEPRLRRFLGDRRLLRDVCEWPTDDPRGVISTLRPVPEGLGTAPCARAVHIGRLLAECVRLRYVSLRPRRHLDHQQDRTFCEALGERDARWQRLAGTRSRRFSGICSTEAILAPAAWRWEALPLTVILRSTQ